MLQHCMDGNQLRCYPENQTQLVPLHAYPRQQNVAAVLGHQPTKNVILQTNSSAFLPLGPLHTYPPQHNVSALHAQQPTSMLSGKPNTSISATRISSTSKCTSRVWTSTNEKCYPSNKHVRLPAVGVATHVSSTTKSISTACTTTNFDVIRETKNILQRVPSKLCTRCAELGQDRIGYGNRTASNQCAVNIELCSPTTLFATPSHKKHPCNTCRNKQEHPYSSQHPRSLCQVIKTSLQDMARQAGACRCSSKHLPLPGWVRSLGWHFDGAVPACRIPCTIRGGEHPSNASYGASLSHTDKMGVELVQPGSSPRTSHSQDRDFPFSQN